MANVNKLKKSLVKLNDEELKDVLAFLADEDEEEEVEEEVVEEVKEEKVEPEKSEPKFLTEEDLQKKLEEILSNYVPKEKFEEIKQEKEKIESKSTSFGATAKASKTPAGTKEEKTAQDYLNIINQKQY